MANNNGENVSSAKYHNKRIKIRCVINGKSTAPYCVPKTIDIRCSKCGYSEEPTIEILPENEDILKLIDISSDSQPKVLSKLLKMCKFCQYKITEMQNIERIFILPPTGKERKTSDLVNVAYYIGYGVETNNLYEMEGYTTVDPSTQMATHVFTRATKLHSDIDSFAISSRINDNLKEFAIEKPNTEKIFDVLESLYTSYAYNITKIYNRFDLHLAIDLTFRFDNEYVHKGWSDVMIIGDTRCGKGYVAERLVEYFGLGEVISGDNCSFAGLVGGLQQYNKHWVITWGKIPLNDRGLVIIDEASEIPETDWTRLSRIRSEGVAEITKIRAQITNARTRIIFLSNPIKKTISNYSYGIQSILDIVKAPEDIARFDYVLVVAHNEVAMEEINVTRDSIPSIHSNILEQQLILWIWSRKIDEIVFSDEAIRLVYKLSIRLASDYSFNIPLIQGENIRVKLAKLAVAFAGRIYSNKQNGKILFVDKVHIECADAFLRMIYGKSVCGYYDYSILNKTMDLTSQMENFKKVEKYFSSFRNKEELCKCLLLNNNITINDLSEHLNQPQEIAREIISTLLRYNCIQKKYNTYVKTPTFTGWLKTIVIKK